MYGNVSMAGKQCFFYFFREQAFIAPLCQMAFLLAIACYAYITYFAWTMKTRST